jgi:hypothetical protein
MGIQTFSIIRLDIPILAPVPKNPRKGQKLCFWVFSQTHHLRIHQLLIFGHKLLYQVKDLFMVSLPVERLQNQLVVYIHFDNLSGVVVFNGRNHCFLKMDKIFLIFRRINQNLSPLLTLSQ